MSDYDKSLEDIIKERKLVKKPGTSPITGRLTIVGPSTGQKQAGDIRKAVGIVTNRRAARTNLQNQMRSKVNVSKQVRDRAFDARAMIVNKQRPQVRDAREKLSMKSTPKIVDARQRLNNIGGRKRKMLKWGGSGYQDINADAHYDTYTSTTTPDQLTRTVKNTRLGINLKSQLNLQKPIDRQKQVVLTGQGLTIIKKQLPTKKSAVEMPGYALFSRSFNSLTKDSTRQTYGQKKQSVQVSLFQSPKKTHLDPEDCGPVYVDDQLSPNVKAVDTRRYSNSEKKMYMDQEDHGIVYVGDQLSSNVKTTDTKRNNNPEKKIYMDQEVYTPVYIGDQSMQNMKTSDTKHYANPKKRNHMDGDDLDIRYDDDLEYQLKQCNDFLREAARATNETVSPGVSRGLQMRLGVQEDGQATNSEIDNAGYQIRVSNLHPKVTHEDIKELFGDIGVLRRVQLYKQGIADVFYAKLGDAKKAIDNYHDRELDGQPMACKFVGPPRAETSSESRLSKYLKTGTLHSDRIATPGMMPVVGTTTTAKSRITPDVNVIHTALFHRSAPQQISANRNASITVTM